MRWRLRHTREVEHSSMTPFERALMRFNASEAGRTVAGLVRALGTPSASVGAAAGTAEEVRVTVAWELSWYQWGIDVGEDPRPVRQLAKGSEVDQLDAAARQWNASVLKGGRIVLVAPKRRRRAAGVPARR